MQIRSNHIINSRPNLLCFSHKNGELSLANASWTSAAALLFVLFLGIRADAELFHRLVGFPSRSGPVCLRCGCHDLTSLLSSFHTLIFHFKDVSARLVPFDWTLLEDESWTVTHESAVSSQRNLVDLIWVRCAGHEPLMVIRTMPIQLVNIANPTTNSRLRSRAL